REPVRRREAAQLLLVAPDQDGVGHDSRPVLESKAAGGSDRQDRADEMLVRPHPPGDAVHDDAETPFAHRCVSSENQVRWPSRVAFASAVTASSQARKQCAWVMAVSVRSRTSRRKAGP